jgi:cell division septation protein DedD
LHAFNIYGDEPLGWPKLTGGWTVATPAIGDLDGDGWLEVVSLTREGWLFAFRTVAAECSTTPWRKFHHDEWNTGNYATDARPPAPIVPQTATLSGGAAGAVTLTLSATPGDDLYCGGSPRIDVRYAAHPIETTAEFEAATVFRILDAPSEAGRISASRLRLQATEPVTPATAYVAARTTDAAGNRSPVTALGQIVLSPEATASPTVITTPTVSATPSATAPPPTVTPTTAGTATPTPTRTPAPSSSGCGVDPNAPNGGAWWIATGLALVVALRRGI